MGLFIVFEGLDGCGAGTQSEILRERLMADKNILFLRYPEYNHPLGELIYKTLKERITIDMETFFMLNAVDQVKDKRKIANALEEGKTIVADRYFLSNIAFQGAKGFDVQHAVKIAEALEIPKPDLVILLRVSPETSTQRKTKEKRNLDVHESNQQYQMKVFDMYEKLAAENVFAKEWIVVDGEKNVEDIANDVENIVKERLNS